MADFGKVVAVSSGFSFTGLNSLANVTYVTATAVDLQTATPDPLDVVIEVELTPGTVAGNKQAKIFLQCAVDGGTNFSTGPTSGTTVTDEPLLHFLGVLPLPTNATLQRKQFSVMAALGFIPTDVKLVIFNDSGAALAASGNAASWFAIKGVSV